MRSRHAKRLPKMTLNIDIKPELEELLVARAHSHGQSLEAYIQDLLESEGGAPEANSSQSLNGLEKAAAFEAWAKSFPANLPILSLESIGRESVYQRD